MDEAIEVECPHCGLDDLIFSAEGDLASCSCCGDGYQLQEGEPTFLEPEEFRSMLSAKLDAAAEHIDTILRRPIMDALEPDLSVIVCTCGCRNDKMKCLVLRAGKCARCGKDLMNTEPTEVKETPHINGMVHGAMHAVDVLSANTRVQNEIAQKIAEHITVGELMAEQTLFCCKIGIKCVWCNPSQQQKLNI